MLSLLQDTRFGLRMLLRAPLFTAVAILTLALGIGANTAIFSVVHAVLLRPLPFTEPERLVMIWETAQDTGDEQVPVAPADFYDWQAGSGTFAGFAGFHPWSFNLTGNGDPERLSGVVATASLFDVLDKKPLLGRVFRADEEAAAPVVVLGHGLWQRRFGGDPKIVGRKLKLDDIVYTVIGVMPQGFEFPSAAELWTPFDRSAEGTIRDFQFMRVIGRMSPDTTLSSARAEMSALASRLAREYPQSNAQRGVNVVPLREQMLGKVQPRLLVLIGGVVLMLIAACFNVANLLLARAIGRREETAVRQALGASRSRLVRQFLTESLLLATLGGLAGLLFAYWGVWSLVQFGPEGVPRLDEASVDGTVLMFTLATTVLVGLIFGLLPAIQGSQFDMRLWMKPRRGRGRLLGTLVSVQIAIALMLLVGAMLLTRSFVHLNSVPPGFDPQNVLTMQVSLPNARYAEPHQVAAFTDQVLQRVEALPGVMAAGTTVSLPIGGGMDIDQSFTVEGEEAAGAEKRTAVIRPVSPGYFTALRIPMVSGRAFGAADRAGAPPVALVNEAMVKRFWPGENPVGRRLGFDVSLGSLGGMENVPREIVGVVGDVKHDNLASDTVPEIYLPASQGTWRFLILVVRTSSDPEPLTRSVLQAIWQADKTLPVTKVRTMNQILSDSVAQPRFYTLLLSAFAAVALVLAAVGIYGLVSYSVTQRTHEIGVRMALGARRRDVIRMVIREGLVLAVLGMLAGVVLSMGLTRFLTSLLFGISANDLASFVAVCAMLAGVALLSSYLPARRAARADPMVSLRLD